MHKPLFAHFLLDNEVLGKWETLREAWMPTRGLDIDLSWKSPSNFVWNRDSQTLFYREPAMMTATAVLKPPKLPQGVKKPNEEEHKKALEEVNARIDKLKKQMVYDPRSFFSWPELLHLTSLSL